MPETARLRDCETIQPASTMGMRCSDGTRRQVAAEREVFACWVWVQVTTRIEMFSDNLNDLNYVNCLAADKECTQRQRQLLIVKCTAQLGGGGGKGRERGKQRE